MPVQMPRALLFTGFTALCYEVWRRIFPSGSGLKCTSWV